MVFQTFCGLILGSFVIPKLLDVWSSGCYIVLRCSHGCTRSWDVWGWWWHQTTGIRAIGFFLKTGRPYTPWTSIQLHLLPGYSIFGRSHLFYSRMTLQWSMASPLASCYPGSRAQATTSRTRQNACVCREGCGQRLMGHGPFGINDGRRMNRLQLDLDQHPPPKSWNLRWQLVIVQWWWAMLRSTENVFDWKRTAQGHLISPGRSDLWNADGEGAAEIGEAAVVTITIQEVSISYHRGPIIHHPSSITHKLINTYFSILHPYPNLPNPHPPCTSFFPGWKFGPGVLGGGFVQRGLGLCSLWPSGAQQLGAAHCRGKQWGWEWGMRVRCFFPMSYEDAEFLEVENESSS